MTLIRITPEYVEHQQYVLASINKWKDYSSCSARSKTEDFFDTSDAVLKTLAKKYCFNCPVRQNCLYTSLINQEVYGLWGGFTPRQRKTYFKYILSKASESGINTKNWSEQLDEYFKHYSNPELFTEQN